MEVFIINKIEINGRIRAKEVRLIGFEGEQLGIKTIKEALDIAQESGLDLVNVSPEAKPPVCKIIDYGRFKYDQQKKDKLNRGNQKRMELKEIKMNPNIGDNDLQTKIRNAVKFFQDDNKVKASIQFKGRSIVHPEVGRKLMEKFIESCTDFSEVEQQPKMEGRHLVAVLKPKK